MSVFRSRWAVAVLFAAVVPLPTMAAQVPADTLVYTVKRGDTLYQLTRDYLTGAGALKQLRAANSVRIPEQMPIGYRLSIPRRLLRFTPVAIRVQTFSGPVSLSLSGKPLPLSKGAEIPEGAQVMTGANGFVVLASADGTRVSLPSNSQVRIGQARRYLLLGATDVELQVDRGKAEVRAAKQSPDSRFRVKTPVAVTAVRGTVFRAGYSDLTGISATETIEGEVAVAAAMVELGVPAGFGAAANAAGDISKELLLPAPALLDPAKVQTEERVSFNFSPVNEATNYRVQVASDAGFLDVIGETQPAIPHSEFSGIGNGTFFVRAAGISAAGLQGLEEGYSFRRQRVGLKVDAGQSSLPGGYRFGWLAEGEGKSLYRFQLFSEGGEALPLVDEAGLEKTEMTLTGLKPGKYQWRVSVIQTTQEGSVEVWMPMQKLTVGG